MIPIPPRYKDLNHAPRVYEAICKTLSDRLDQVDWHAFSPADWRLLPAMAKQEGVAPLLYWAFKDGNTPEGCPEHVFSALKTEYYNTLANNTLLFNELERVLEVLDRANIPVILLKGAALAPTVYENIGLRPMGDLDLLVKADHFPETYALGQEMGYQEYVPELRPGFNRVFKHHIALRKDKVILEIHWTLISGAVDRRSPPGDWGWDRVQARLCPVLNGKNVNLLHPEEHTLYVSAHAALQHDAAQSQLLWFYDIYLLYKRLQKDSGWDGSLITEARALGWHDAVIKAASQVKSCFGTPLPAFAQKAQNLGDVQYKKKIHSHKGLYKVPYAYAQLMPGRARMQYLYHPEPAWLWPVYYPLHWGKILSELLSHP